MEGTRRSGRRHGSFDGGDLAAGILRGVAMDRVNHVWTLFIRSRRARFYCTSHGSQRALPVNRCFISPPIDAAKRHKPSPNRW